MTCGFKKRKNKRPYCVNLRLGDNNKFAKSAFVPLKAHNGGQILKPLWRKCNTVNNGPSTFRGLPVGRGIMSKLPIA